MHLYPSLHFRLAAAALFFCFFCVEMSLIAQTNVSLTCTEINYNSDPSTASGNWIELHNFGTTPINLANHRLQEQGAPDFYTLPNNSTTTIAAGGYLVLSDNITQFQQAYPGVTNVVGSTLISLGNNGDTVELKRPDGSLLLTIGYDDNIDWPQCADGYGRTLDFRFPDQSAGLLIGANWRNGCMGGSPGTAYTPCVEPLFFNEINYRSSTTQDAGDWVELWNKSGQPLNLSGWQLRDSRDTLRYTFPINTILLADEYLVIFQDLTKFQNVHGTNVNNKIGPFQFALDGNGEVIRLFDQSENLFLSMFYNDTAPWPLSPDGEGPTLEFRGPGLDQNDGNSWGASCLFGTPGRLNSDCSVSTEDLDNQLVARVFPNPSSGVFYVEMPDSAPRQWLVQDLMGRTLRTGTTAATNWSLDLSGCPDGVYVLRVVGAEAKMVVRQ
jgi:hypothetical protein